jgi:hypothetical protein
LHSSHKNRSLKQVLVHTHAGSCITGCHPLLALRLSLVPALSAYTESAVVCVKVTCAGLPVALWTRCWRMIATCTLKPSDNVYSQSFLEAMLTRKLLDIGIYEDLRCMHVCSLQDLGEFRTLLSQPLCSNRSSYWYAAGYRHRISK